MAASARATMRDVAALAGVSTKTVSNVVSGTAFVRPETNERVEPAMLELDFVPNLSARGLRNGRTGMIAVALPDLSTAYSAELLHLIVEAAHRRGLAVQVEETASEPHRERELLSRARSHLVDGLILNPIRLEDTVVPRTDRLPPVVLIGEVEQHRTDCVLVDNQAAAGAIVQHVLAQGGTGFFPRRLLRADLQAGRLVEVPGTPGFSLPAYLCHPAPVESSRVQNALDSIRRAASAIKGIDA